MKFKDFWMIRFEINLPPVRFSAEYRREREKEVEDKPNQRKPSRRKKKAR